VIQAARLIPSTEQRSVEELTPQRDRNPVAMHRALAKLLAAAIRPDAH